MNMDRLAGGSLNLGTVGANISLSAWVVFTLKLLLGTEDAGGN
jgi:hypothetical protein